MTLEKALQTAAAESSEYFTRFIESSYAPESKYIPSPAFERKIKKLSHRADHPVRYRIGRAVACALLAAVLCFGSVMAVSPSARATVVRWVVEWYETHIVYRYTGDPPAEAIPQYEITALPEGYIETERLAYSTSASVLYESPDGGIICLDYVYMHQGAATIIVEDEAIPVSVNGLEGQLYLAAQQDGAGTNTITWIDPEANIQFTMDTPLGQDVLLHMAESVHQRDSDETNSTAMPQYEIAALPEGYVETDRMESASSVSILYEDRNGGIIYFEYLYMQQGSSTIVTTDDNMIDITVNGLQGQLFLPTETRSMTTIVWIDPQSNIHFIIDTTLDESAVMHMAKSVHQRDSDETNSTAMPQYVITALPDGYIEAEDERIEEIDYVQKTYRNEGDSAAQTIYFDYIYMHQGSARSFVTEDADVKSISINGMEGLLFISDDWENQRSTITWTDSINNLQFTLDAAVEESTILRMAESVMESNE